MRQRTYSILGTGAIGGYYGACLQQAGHQVRYLARSDFQHLKNHGLTIKSVRGNFDLPKLEVFQTPENMPPSDVVVVAWKTTSNQYLQKILPAVIHPESVVLMLQNGLRPEVEAEKILPDHPVLGGLCFICAQKIHPGEVCHLDYGAVRIGQHSGPGNDELLASIVNDFKNAGLEAVAENDLKRARWEKLVWNIPYNGLAALLEADTKKLMNHIPTRSMIELLMNEVALAAASEDVLISREFVNRMLQNTQKMIAYEPSMLLDRLSGRHMELDAIYDQPLAEAEKAGISLPNIRFLSNALHFIQELNPKS